MKASRATFCLNCDGREISSLRDGDSFASSTGLLSSGFLDVAVDRRTGEGLDGSRRDVVSRTEQRHRFVAVVPNSRVCGCLLISGTEPVDGTFDITTYMENAILTCE
jgi:hypothetical protein